jgi:membrane-bound lytic murein transglycosylase B
MSRKRSVYLVIVSFLFFSGVSTALADAGLDAWLVDLRAEARGAGISDKTLDAALTNVALIPRVIELDRKQPEFTLTFAQYLERVVPAERQEKARARFSTHRDLLTEVGEKYGVQPRFIVALWGIETDFGRVLGGFDVIPALVSLAYDGRRSAYFRKELIAALKIIDEGHVTADSMKGSWAGAMGQSQFMPTSFRSFAEDYDKDGRRDIWSTQADVFASAANYLKKSGWRNDMTWGREVRLPTTGEASPASAMRLHDNKTWKPLSDWGSLGIRNVDGTALPSRAIRARLVLPDGADGRSYLVYGNFEAILRWNRSNYFAIAVGTLSDSMR